MGKTSAEKVDGNIRVILDLVDGRNGGNRTLYHEGFHAAWKLFLTQEQIDLIGGYYARKLGLDAKNLSNANWVEIEEAAADAAADYIANKAETPPGLRKHFQAFWDRIRSFLVSVGIANEDMKLNDLFWKTETDQLEGTGAKDGGLPGIESAQTKYKLAPEGYEPKETIKKLYKLVAYQDGKLYPLFVKDTKNSKIGDFEIGKWLKAEIGDNTSTKLGELAFRPGLHSGKLPYAPWLMRKGENAGKYEWNRVWVEVEIAADKNYQDEAAQRPYNKGLDYIPENGYYVHDPKHKHWYVSGEMKINKILSPAEVDAINKEAGIDSKFENTPRSKKRSLDWDKIDTNTRYKLADAELGENYSNFAGDPVGAYNQLLKEKKGHVSGAFERKDIGKIDLIWGKGGKSGFGLAHIIEKHPEINGQKLQEIVENGEINKQSSNRIILEHKNSTGVIRLEWNGASRLWVLTAFENKSSQSSAESTDTSETGSSMTPDDKQAAIYKNKQGDANSQTKIDEKGEGKTDDGVRYKLDEAYHGSGALFNRFDVKHIGSGVGLNAYGWGIYVSDNIEVAKGYAKRIAEGRKHWTVEGDEYKPGEPARYMNLRGAFESKLKNASREEIEAFCLKELRKADPKYLRSDNDVALTKEIIDSIDARTARFLIDEALDGVNGYAWYDGKRWKMTSFQSSIPEGAPNIQLSYEYMPDWIKESKGDGYTYGLSVWEKHQEDVIQWERTIKPEQAEKINRQARKEGLSEIDKDEMGANVHRIFALQLQSEEAASKFLLRAGIDGIKYYTIDHGSDKLSNNYVVFDDSQIRIIDTQRYRLANEDAPEYTNKWIDGTGDIVAGDTIEFTETVWGGSYKKPVKRGDRTIRAFVRKDSYGKDKQQHTFSIEVIASEGTEALAAGTKTTRKGRNVYRNGTKRLQWADENQRHKVADEKHERGDAARAARDERRSGFRYRTADESTPSALQVAEGQRQMEAVRKKYEGTDKWLKAPNGKPTNLTEQQWIETRTENFKKKFGDWENDPKNATKVIDENGEPMVVKHGSNAKFNEFKIKQQTDAGWLGAGYYFFGNADIYASQYGENLYEVFLDIKNPYIVSDEEHSALANQDDKKFSAEFSQNLIDDGYDGAIFDGDLNYEIVAYSSNQIKSATDNVGTFDGGNADIRYRTAPTEITGTETLVSDEDYQSPYRYIYPNVRGGWTKDKIKRTLMQAVLKWKAYGIQGVLKQIAAYDNADDFAKHIFYHGTGGYIDGGLKPSIGLSARKVDVNRFGGGYGERYWSASVSKSKNIASNFSGESDGVSVYPVLLKKDAKVISRPDIQDATEIEDIIVELWDKGVDAVIIGDWRDGYSEQELAIINPFAVYTYNNAEYHRAFGKPKLNNLSNEEIKALYDKAMQMKEGGKHTDEDIKKSIRFRLVPENQSKSAREIVNPIDPRATDQEKVMQLEKLREEAIPVFRDLLQEISKVLGLEVKDSLKKNQAAIDKTHRPGKPAWYSLEHLGDYYRGSVILDDQRQIVEIAKMIDARGMGVVEFDFSKTIKPEKFGYRDMNFILRMPNGLMVEFQALVKEIAEVKPELHKIYEKWREYSKEQIKEMGRFAEYYTDRQKSVVGYNNAWRSALTRWGISQEELSNSLMKDFITLGLVSMPITSIASAGDKKSSDSQTPSADRKKGMVGVKISTLLPPHSVDTITSDNFIVTSNDKISQESESARKSQDKSDEKTRYRLTPEDIDERLKQAHKRINKYRAGENPQEASRAIAKEIAKEKKLNANVADDKIGRMIRAAYREGEGAAKEGLAAFGIAMTDAFIETNKPDGTDKKDLVFHMDEALGYAQDLGLSEDDVKNLGADRFTYYLQGLNMYAYGNSLMHQLNEKYAEKKGLEAQGITNSKLDSEIRQKAGVFIGLLCQLRCIFAKSEFANPVAAPRWRWWIFFQRAMAKNPRNLR